MSELKAFVNFSGGLGSWASSKLAVEQYGKDNVTLVFADTLIEDNDLYRFMVDAVANVFGLAPWTGLQQMCETIPPVTEMERRKLRLATIRATAMERFHYKDRQLFYWLADGRTPWEVYRDERFLGNSRADPCSRILKRQLLDQWFDEHCPRPTTRLVVGLGQWERERFEGNGLDPTDKGYKPGLRKLMAERDWTFEAPLIYRTPIINRYDLEPWAEREGLTVSRAYEEGFSHDNCGGECCKAGQGHWLKMYRNRRDRFDNAEQRENELREQLGDVAMMKETRNGQSFPLPLSVFRERIERGDECPLFDGPPCNCFTGV